MYHYITARLTGLSGIRSLETTPIIGRFKQAGPATPGLSGPAGACLSAAGCGNERRRGDVPHVVGDVDRAPRGDDLVDAVEHVV